MVRKAGPVAAAVAALAFAGAASAGEPVVLEAALLDAVTAGVPTANATIVNLGGVIATIAVPGSSYKLTADVRGTASTTATAAGAKASLNFSSLQIGVNLNPFAAGSGVGAQSFVQLFVADATAP